MARPSTNSTGADLKLMSAWPGVRSGSLVRRNPPPAIAPGSNSSDELLSVNHGSFHSPEPPSEVPLQDMVAQELPGAV